ncbi:MAG: hypothetical protein JXQ23_09620 [Clostridia bacterium]|nr:hypothetical protein [Clostridia bacterium]
MDNQVESNELRKAVVWKAKRMSRRNILLIVFSVLISAFLIYILLTQKTGIEEYVNPPVQIDQIQHSMIEYEGKFGPVDMTLLAEYSISGVVRSKKNYQIDTASMVSPMDLVLAWGNLNSESVKNDITFSQSGRWYYYHVKNNADVTLNDVMMQSSNTHIIPENDSILKQLRKIKEKDLIELKGYLVSVQLFEGETPWTSSLTRNDSGDKSCEIMYVTEVNIK